MNESGNANTICHSLRTYGADLARWPADRAQGVRENLLCDQGFRRDWDAERVLDRAISEARRSLDEDMRRTGALERVRADALRKIAARPFAGLKWQRVAAAIVLAGVLGGAMDMVLVEPESEPVEIVALDLLLYAPEIAELR